MVDDLVRQFAELKARGSKLPGGQSWYYWFQVGDRSFLSVFTCRELTDDDLTELWVLFKLGGWHHVRMRLDEINGRRTTVLLNGKPSS